MMDRVGKPELATQRRVIRFFCSRLGYTYLGNWKDRESRNIDQEKLLAWLTGRGYAPGAAARGVEQLAKAASNLQEGLYSANREVYQLLKYGAKVRESPEEHEVTVYFIDWERPENNLFELAEEVTVTAGHQKRPDLVMFLNGIAMAVLELKRSTVSVFDGVRQNLTNQQEMFIAPFFTTIQLCLAGNDSEGLRYGVIGTPEKHYLEWKEDGFPLYPEERSGMDVRLEELCRAVPNRLDRGLQALFDRERFLTLVHDFLIFDREQKKICRYNQYYGIMRARSRLACGEGGIIWHTQGSGKSLTMIWLSKWLLSHIPTARVLVVTDRDELDEQIERNYRGVDETIVRTRSGADLLRRLNSYEDRLLCSLIQKFGRRGGQATGRDYDRYIQELRDSLPRAFSAKGDIYVFVDECHRTQSGKLHLALKTIIPNAVFVGFTGTPLLRSDRSDSVRVFGRYIHTYKFDEGVADGVVLDLRYECRDVPQELLSQRRIDAWFDAKTRGMTPRGKARLKQLWSGLRAVYASRSRLERIVCDIIFDFETRPRLASGGGNAMLAVDDVLTACRYYELFQQRGLKKCAVISSYEPSLSRLRTETVSEEEETREFEKYRIYLRMLGLDPARAEQGEISRRLEEFETGVKKKFVEEPGQMKLLIVVDKLLTGFDAPPCTCLYLDKSISDHSLFQAVCRVNRLDGEDKDFGYIIDYRHLFGGLAEAMRKYTSGAFGGYEDRDVEGLLKDRRLEARRDLQTLLEELDRLCEGVRPPRGELEYMRFFCGEETESSASLRRRLYRLAGALIRAWAEWKSVLDEADCPPDRREEYRKAVTFYGALRNTIGRSSGDFIDLKAWAPGMRCLIDNYIAAGDIRQLGGFQSFTLLDFILERRGDLTGADPRRREGAAVAIENNLRRKAAEYAGPNPKYFQDMSVILEETVARRERNALDYARQLERYMELERMISRPEEGGRYPEPVRGSAAMRALYDNTGGNADLAVSLHTAVLSSKMDRFRGDPIKERRIKGELLKLLKSRDEVERIFQIVVNQEEY